MNILNLFSGFVKRVLKSTKGKINGTDWKLLKHILNRNSERNLILARGLFSALNIHSPSKKDINTIRRILDNGNIRSFEGKEKPFTEKEKTVLSKIFKKYGLPQKVADWITVQKDSPLYSQMSYALNINERRKTKNPKNRKDKKTKKTIVEKKVGKKVVKTIYIKNPKKQEKKLEKNKQQ